MSNPNEEFNGDPWVQEVQIWYNTEYQGKTGYVKIENDGIVGPGTCKALIRALQIELGIYLICLGVRRMTATHQKGEDNYGCIY